jgi:hypothetical protein
MCSINYCGQQATNTSGDVLLSSSLKANRISYASKFTHKAVIIKKLDAV